MMRVFRGGNGWGVLTHTSKAWETGKSNADSSFPGRNFPLALARATSQDSKDMSDFMRLAIESARKGVQDNEGGPFGACIIRQDRVIAISHNTVLRDLDPTAHAEVNAIRQACRTLNTFILADCELFTTAEPCPMCLAAIYWARIPQVHIGVPRQVAAAFGFDDERFYSELKLPPSKRTVCFTQDVMSTECREVFQSWKNLNRPLY